MSTNANEIREVEEESRVDEAIRYLRESSIKQINERFGPYRRPTELTIPKFQKIQEKALEFALLINELCPSSQQRNIALTLLEQCKMEANAAIAIHS